MVFNQTDRWRPRAHKKRAPLGDRRPEWGEALPLATGRAALELLRCGNVPAQKRRGRRFVGTNGLMVDRTRMAELAHDHTLKQQISRSLGAG